MAKNWIAGAIKHPGALHKQLGVPMGEKIPAKKLSAAAEKGGKLGQRARLAETLKGFSHLPSGVQLTPTGDIGAHREAEAKELGTFKGVKSYQPGWVNRKPRIETDAPYSHHKGTEDQ